MTKPTLVVVGVAGFRDRAPGVIVDARLRDHIRDTFLGKTPPLASYRCARGSEYRQ
jgi:hypothetical protein